MRELPGRRKTTTRLFSQLTPDHEQGEESLVFQRSVRPPREERRVRSADLSAAISEFVVVKSSENATVMSAKL